MTSTYTVKKPVAWSIIVVLVALIVLVIVLPITAKRDGEIQLHTAYTNYITHYDDFSPENDPFAWTPEDPEAQTRVVDFANARASLLRHSPEQLRGQANTYAWTLTGPMTPGFAEEDGHVITANGSVGSFLNIDDPGRVREWQALAVQSPIGTGVPLLFGRDVIHGYAAIFPLNLGLAAAFDEDLVYQGARHSAVEAKSKGINWTFNPMLDVTRDPRWGRISEGHGEDAYLTGVLGAAAVRGYQDGGIIACIKHVGIYGVARGGRDYTHGQMGRNVMFNQYLEAYRRAFKAKPGSAMASFNTIAGIPTHHNRWFLTDVLRGHWGFDGFIVADWAGIQDGFMMRTVTSGDITESAYRGIYAGVDMNMADLTYWSGLADDADLEIAPDGRTYREHLERSVKRILAVKERWGWTDLYDFTEQELPLPDAMDAAQDAAEKSAVLLKNGDFGGAPALPLAPPVEGEPNQLLLIGQLSASRRGHQGSWTPNGVDYNRTVETIYNAFVGGYGQFPGEETTEAEGTEEEIPEWIRDPDGDVDSNSRLEWAYERGYNTTWNCTADMSKEYGDQALEKFMEMRPKTVVFVVGEFENQSGEGTSRTDLTMAGRQLEIVKRIHAANKEVPENGEAINAKLILLVMAGRPLNIAWEVENLDAIMYLWNNGSRGGPAAYRLLHGEISPSGKTPITFPRNEGQIPIFYQAFSTRGYLHNREDWDRNWSDFYWCMSVNWTEDEETGEWSIDNYQGGRCYAAMYLDSPTSPLFWFGHGLTYSEFSYSNARLSRTQISVAELEQDDDNEETVTVTFNVNRVGDTTIPVTEIVQVYIRDVRASVAPTWKNLRGFTRVEFSADPNETNTKEASVVLNLKDDFGFYNEQMDWVVEAGRFEIIVAKDAYDEEHVLDFYVVDTPFAPQAPSVAAVAH